MATTLIGSNPTPDTPINLPATTRDRLTKCFARGMHLARVEKDHDYAHELISQCVLEDPANLEYAEGLFENLRAKFVQTKRGRHAHGLGGYRAFKKALSHEDWLAALRLGLPLLAHDPRDVWTLHAMAEACAALHFNEVELVYLKQALDAAPKDANVSRHCARSLARMGQIDQAIACWHRVEVLVENDREAAKMIAQLTERKMKNADQPRPINGAAVTAREQEVAEESAAVTNSAIGADVSAASLSPRQRLEAAIRDDPADVTNYLELAKLLSELELFESAVSTLQTALERCAQQQTIHDLLDEIRRQQLSAAELAEEARQRAQRRKQRDTQTSLLAAGVSVAAAVLFFQLFPHLWTTLVETLGGGIRSTLLLGNVGMLAVLIWLRARTS